MGQASTPAAWGTTRLAQAELGGERGSALETSQAGQRGGTYPAPTLSLRTRIRSERHPLPPSALHLLVRALTPHSGSAQRPAEGPLGVPPTPYGPRPQQANTKRTLNTTAPAKGVVSGWFRPVLALPDSPTAPHFPGRGQWPQRVPNLSSPPRWGVTPTLHPQRAQSRLCPPHPKHLTAPTPALGSSPLGPSAVQMGNRCSQSHALAQGTVQKFTLPSLLENYAVGQMWSWSFLRRGEQPGVAEGSRRAPRHCPGDWPRVNRAGPGERFLHPLRAPPQLQHRQETETKPKHQWSLASSYHPGQENATCWSAAWSRRPSSTPRRSSCWHLSPRRMAKPTPTPRPGHPLGPRPQRSSGTLGSSGSPALGRPGTAAPAPLPSKPPQPPEPAGTASSDWLRAEGAGPTERGPRGAEALLVRVPTRPGPSPPPPGAAAAPGAGRGRAKPGADGSRDSDQARAPRPPPGGPSRGGGPDELMGAGRWEPRPRAPSGAAKLGGP